MGRIALEQGLPWSKMMTDCTDWATEQLRRGNDATNLSDRQQRPTKRH
jgi:hypothetical protein